MQKRPQSERNIAILNAVLDGETLASVGDRFCITPVRVREIVHALAKQKDEELYALGKTGPIWHGHYLGLPSLKYLRDRKEAFRTLPS